MNARQRLLLVFVVLLGFALGTYQWILENYVLTTQSAELVLVLLFLLISLSAWQADKHLYRASHE